jgi:hypothetical protein
MDEVEFLGRFAERIELAIEKRDITKTEAAARSKLPAKRLYTYTDGTRRIPLYDAYRIARGLNVSMDWLSGHKVTPPKCVYDVIDTGYVCTRCRYQAGYNVRNYKYCPGCGAEIKQKTERNFCDI